MNKQRKNNDGSGGAKNPLKTQITGLSAGVDDIRRESIYIAMLDRYFGISGLVYPLVNEKNGQKYTFDFYQPASGALIKVFTSLEQQQIERYSEYAESCDLDLIFVVDTLTLGLANAKCGGCGGELPPNDKILLDAVEEAGAFLFHEGRLWELDPFDDMGSDHHVWAPVIPIQHQAVVHLLSHIKPAPLGLARAFEEELG